jgi:hypothetical protein
LSGARKSSGTFESRDSGVEERHKAASDGHVREGRRRRRGAGSGQGRKNGAAREGKRGAPERRDERSDETTEYATASLTRRSGPINTLAVHPQGKAYASGAEDGFVRVHWVSRVCRVCAGCERSDRLLVANSTRVETIPVHSKESVGVSRRTSYVLRLRLRCFVALSLRASSFWRSWRSCFFMSSFVAPLTHAQFDDSYFRSRPYGDLEPEVEL